MNPELAKKLLENIPELREFIDFVALECKKLDNLSDITLTSPVDIAVEVKSRQMAYNKLVDILKPLLNVQEFSGSNGQDYVV